MPVPVARLTAKNSTPSRAAFCCRWPEKAQYRLPIQFGKMAMTGPIIVE